MEVIGSDKKFTAVSASAESLAAKDYGSSSVETRQKRFPSKTAFNALPFSEGKLPPQAIEAEVAVLGAILINEDAIIDVVDSLKSKYFYKTEHQYIYKAVQSLYEKSQKIDILTVSQELRASGDLERAGGVSYVASLTNKIASSAHIEAHTKIVQQKYIQRELIGVGSTIVKDAYEDTTDIIELLDSAEGRLLGVSEDNFRSDYTDIRLLVKEAVEEIGKLMQNEDKLSGCPSGYQDLDRITNGWQKGNLLILAGRPGMGKTSFALSMLRNMAVEHKMPVAFFSLEMSALEVTNKLISMEASIKGEKLKSGDLSAEEKTHLDTNLDSLMSAPIYIDETPALSIFELRAKCRKLKQKQDIQMVIIDYLQLMRGSGEFRGMREQEISGISRQLKSLAKELKIPIMALAQLSRAVESRPDKKPILSDLRESGAIEQDADMVMFVYRPEYYRLLEDENHESTVGKAFILVEKHRSGSTGQVRFNWIKDYARFDPDTASSGYGLDSFGSMANPNFGIPGEATTFVEYSSKMNGMTDEELGIPSDNSVVPF